MFPKHLSKALEKRQAENLFRTLSIPNSELGVDFYSNDYLGLAKNSSTIEVSSKGSTGSRLISGNSSEHELFEDAAAQFFHSESALLFNSGYNANSGVISALTKRGETILYDQHIHASLREAISASPANSYGFKHNNTIHLETLLNKTTGNCYVVIESHYSMEGDEAPLEQICALLKKHNAYGILDEAHSLAWCGKEGKGLSIEKQLHETFLSRVYTFGKGAGYHGAVVCGSKELKNYLINFSRPFIYTTALPPHEAIILKERLDEIKQASAKREHLIELISFFNTESKKLNSPFNQSESPIQSLMIGDTTKVQELALSIQQAGFEVKPIRYPTVAKGTERIRVILHAFNTKEEITAFLKTIQNLL